MDDCCQCLVVAGLSFFFEPINDYLKALPKLEKFEMDFCNTTRRGLGINEATVSVEITRAVRLLASQQRRA